MIERKTMERKISRRATLKLGAAALLAGYIPRYAYGQSIPERRATVLLVEFAANSLLQALDQDQRRQATFAFDDPERVRWHWTVNAAVPRNGLPLRDMTPPQRDLALALLQASLSRNGYEKALAIMALQTETPAPDGDPLLFFVSIFGTPGGDRWGWRFEGHHLSRHFTVVDGQLSLAPFFHGARPTVTDSGTIVMRREEEAARELVTSLPTGLREVAVFSDVSLRNHLTGNAVAVDPLDPVGVALSDLPEPQRALAAEIIGAYLESLPEAVAAEQWVRLQDAGLDDIRFGWAGSAERFEPHYYRLQGPTFVLEFDNSRNSGTHIHSVWRDFSQDFGRHLLRRG